METLSIDPVGYFAGWIVPVAMGLASLAAGIWGQNKQNKENRRIARSQNDANKEFLAQQLEYNTPKNQMSRFQEAGLNPNLVYGQGNPGSQSAPQTAADIRPADYQKLGEVLPLMNQTSLVQSQVQAQNQKTRALGVQMELQKVQKSVLEKNPLLDPVGFNAIIDSLKFAAESKAAQAGMDTATAQWFKGDKSFKVNGVEMHGPAGVLKLETELKLLEQKYDLGNTDRKIKAEILNSKAFQNDILEVQKKFLADGEIGAQQIYQFIQLLLMKML